MSSRVVLRNELTVGRHGLSASFRRSRPYTLRAGEALAAPVWSSRVIYHLVTGWVCQYRNLPDGRRAIADVYLPGDVIGLDAALLPRPRDEIAALTSVSVEFIAREAALVELMASRPTALYIAWLLSQRQRRADHRLTAISCLDARGRLAAMVLDFYTRSCRRKLPTGTTFILPLTQIQIANYLGLSVVCVNRVLRSLSDERIFQLEKQCATILDLDRLTSLAQNEITECPTSGTGEWYTREIAAEGSEVPVAQTTIPALSLAPSR